MDIADQSNEKGIFNLTVCCLHVCSTEDLLLLIITYYDLPNVIIIVYRSILAFLFDFLKA